MFLLTEGPRLFYVDAANMVLKGEIPWLVLESLMQHFRFRNLTGDPTL